MMKEVLLQFTLCSINFGKIENYENSDVGRVFPKAVLSGKSGFRGYVVRPIESMSQKNGFLGNRFSPCTGITGNGSYVIIFPTQ